MIFFFYSETDYQPPPLDPSESSFVPLVIDDSEVALGAGGEEPGIVKQKFCGNKAKKILFPELYEQGGLPRPRFVMLGQQGVGEWVRKQAM